LGIGETHEAIRHLETAAAMLAEFGLRDPSVVQWAPDLVEAYVRAGRIADARRLLDHFEAQAERTERTWALAATARCRGLLAAEAEFAYHFAAAFRWHDRTETPFEWARTALCLGARLRRAGRRPEARVHLRAALVTLERLGATPWAQRARAELRLAGDQADVASWAERRLTPKEAEVAWLVSQGRTNREVATALGVTPRTVAFHLGNIYRKLDVRSRADLLAARPIRMLAG
ncbi:MAG: helix-turn-helix transcriptional regulator, partial [Egibacteraceae bacterium]